MDRAGKAGHDPKYSPASGKRFCYRKNGARLLNSGSAGEF